ncbi:MAG: hypothetical protein AVDCRST_MAG09-234, partial [uncultured Sphingomonas sp.]
DLRGGHRFPAGRRGELLRVAAGTVAAGARPGRTGRSLAPGRKRLRLCHVLYGAAGVDRGDLPGLCHARPDLAGLHRRCHFHHFRPDPLRDLSPCRDRGRPDPLYRPRTADLPGRNRGACGGFGRPGRGAQQRHPAGRGVRRQLPAVRPRRDGRPAHLPVGHRAVLGAGGQLRLRLSRPGALQRPVQPDRPDPAAPELLPVGCLLHRQRAAGLSARRAELEPVAARGGDRARRHAAALPVAGRVGQLCPVVDRRHADDRRRAQPHEARL